MKQLCFDFASVAKIGDKTLDRKQYLAWRKKIDKRARELYLAALPPSERLAAKTKKTNGVNDAKEENTDD